MQVITTSSPKNFDLVKTLGAHAVFDYRDPEVSAKIKAEYSDLMQAVDCIANETTVKQVSDAMSDVKQAYVAMALTTETSNIVKKNIKTEFALVHTLLGKVRPFRTLEGLAY